MNGCILKEHPAGIYLLKINNRNTKTRCEISSKLTLKIPERHHWRRSRIIIVTFEHVVVGWGNDDRILINSYA